MQLFKLDTPTNEFKPEYDDFGTTDIKELSRTKAEVVFYWYIHDMWSGIGEILLLKNGEWYLYNCGHCSCYGPTEDMVDSLINPMQLNEIESRCSAEHWEKNVKALVNFAIRKGYK